jgi:fatty-acyl-CoA synthase
MTLTSSYATGSTREPLIEETIGRHFEAVARRFPDREALVSRHQDKRFTYAQLDTESTRLASALLRSGMAPGDRAGIWAHNCYEWLLMQLATAKAGIVLVNINPAYRVTELEYALNKVGCKLLVTMTAYKTSDYLAIVRELAPELPRAAPGELLAARAPQLRCVVQLGDEPQPGMLSFAEFMARGDAADSVVADAGRALTPTDPVNIHFTSGPPCLPREPPCASQHPEQRSFIGEHEASSRRICSASRSLYRFRTALGKLA